MSDGDGDDISGGDNGANDDKMMKVMVLMTDDIGGDNGVNDESDDGDIGGDDNANDI